MAYSLARLACRLPASFTRGIKKDVRLGLTGQRLCYSTETNDGILLADSCVKQLNKITSGSGGYLRVMVEGGGCSGFQYKFELEQDNINESEDKVFEREGAKIVIDETSLDYLKGSTIEYHTELIRSAFRIAENPQADQGCSCGASFSIKIE